MNTNKYSLLKNLDSGDPFIFRGSEVFRNMFLVHSSDSRCVVKGEKAFNTPSGELKWEPFTDSCAPDAEVFYDSAREKMEFEEESGVESTMEPTAKARAVKVDAEPAKRGRKQLHSISLPIDTEFTVAQVAADLKVEKYVVNNEVARIKKASPSSVKEVRTITKGRGKPAKVFKISRF